MSTSTATLATRPPRRALGKLIGLEFKIALRAPVGLVLGVAVPVMLLAIFGETGAFEKKIATTTITYRTEFVPILIGLVLVLIALVALPIPIVNQRESAYLRRLSTTPVAPRWLLAAQLAVDLVLAGVAMVLIVAGDVLLFGVHAPAQWAGFILAALLATLALFALGLVIAAIAPSAQAAAVMGTILLYPLLFFAGMWTPRATMSPLLHHISNLTPLGAAVQAMLNAMQGTFPTIGSLGVMAAWALLGGFAAVKLFRWE